MSSPVPNYRQILQDLEDEATAQHQSLSSYVTYLLKEETLMDHIRTLAKQRIEGVPSGGV